MSPAQRVAPWLRHVLAAMVLVLVLTLWVTAGLMAREIIPGSAQRADQLFAAALGATYVGAWVIAAALAQTPRLMVFRAVGTTITAVLIVAILELPAAFKWLHWSLVFRSLAGEGTHDYMTSYVRDPELSFRRIPGLYWTARPHSDFERQPGSTPHFADNA